MKLRALRYTLLLSGLFGISFLLRASLPSVATGTWVAAGNMSAARSGACTVALNDGRLLISGGADANGPTATAELFSATGCWSAAASMNSPRSHQSCAVLQDGRVLVAGGTTDSCFWARSDPRPFLFCQDSPTFKWHAPASPDPRRAERSPDRSDPAAVSFPLIQPVPQIPAFPRQHS